MVKNSFTHPDGLDSGLDKLTAVSTDGWYQGMAIQCMICLTAGFLLATVIRLAAASFLNGKKDEERKERNANRPAPPWPWIRSALEIVADNQSQSNAQLPVEIAPWLYL